MADQPEHVYVCTFEEYILYLMDWKFGFYFSSLHSSSE
jgi:hypothetical protein